MLKIYCDKKCPQLATNEKLLKRINVLAELHERAKMKAADLENKGFHNLQAILNKTAG